MGGITLIMKLITNESNVFKNLITYPTRYDPKKKLMNIGINHLLT